ARTRCRTRRYARRQGTVPPHQLHAPRKATGRGGGGGCATRTAKIVRAGAAGPELCRPPPDSARIGTHRSARAGRERTPIGLSGSLPLRWIGRSARVGVFPG